MLSENKLKLNDMSHEIEKINLIFEKDKKNLENNCQAQITSLQASHDKVYINKRFYNHDYFAGNTGFFIENKGFSARERTFGKK